MSTKCTVFFISDSTGITAETFGNSLLMQFEGFEFECITHPYINSVTKAKEVAEKINQALSPKLVFSTLIDPKVREVLLSCETIDLFDKCLAPVEKALNTKYSQHIGKLHAMRNVKTYDMRINAIQYSLNADDGGSTNHYEMADVVLVGVSRSGKTPTCLYMAMKYGTRAANYPLTAEDLSSAKLPEVLVPYRKKLFGLVINAQRLHDIREQRLNKSEYASLEQCEKELGQVEKIFAREKIPYLNSTEFSIEELATRIMQACHIKRQ